MCFQGEVLPSYVPRCPGLTAREQGRTVKVYVNILVDGVKRAKTGCAGADGSAVWYENLCLQFEHQGMLIASQPVSCGC